MCVREREGRDRDRNSQKKSLKNTETETHTQEEESYLRSFVFQTWEPYSFEEKRKGEEREMCLFVYLCERQKQRKTERQRRRKLTIILWKTPCDLADNGFYRI